MKKDAVIQVLDNLEEHPAVRAWSRLTGSTETPRAVSKLKDRAKTMVYRLEGMDPAGGHIIAKRTPLVAAITERTVYREVLPHLPFPALKCHGFTEDDNPQFTWLFMEDAGEQWCQPEIPEHRIALSRWLAIMHASATAVRAAALLPERGPRHYLDLLRLGRQRLAGNLRNPALGPDDVATLEAIVSEGELVESHWSQVDEFCERMPKTLVHGDVAAKNLRIRTSASEIILYPLDWDTAGWAVPAADLACDVDLAAYGMATGQFLDSGDLDQLALYGRIFRLLAAIEWASRGLESDWRARPLRQMKAYQGYLVDSICAADWGA